MRRIGIFSQFLFVSIVGAGFKPAPTYADPIVGPCASTLFRQQFLFKSHFMYINFSEEYDKDGWRQLEGDSSYNAILSLWEAQWGFENVMTFRGAFQINYQQGIMAPDPPYGIGDIIVDAKYCIYDPSKELEYAGILYPTFSVFAGTRVPAGGNRATPPPLARWLGRGTVDLEVGGMARIGNSIGAFHGMIGYWYNGVVGEDRPDDTFYNATLEGPALFGKNKLIILCELDGSKIGRYHYLLQLCPGIQYIIAYGRGVRVKRIVEHKVAIQASFPMPIEAEGGFKYDFAPFVGVSWTF